jgi:ornithine cyclodeaminase
MRSIPFYSRDDVHRLLDMDGCIGAVRDAMIGLTRSPPQPLRSIVELAPGKLFALMPGSLPVPDGFGAKVVTAFSNPDQPGRSVHRGLVVLFDFETGEVECIADAGEVTEVRTAAASAVATAALARDDARRLAIFGTGAQAASHLRAIVRVRPIEGISIWGRTAEAARTLAGRTSEELGIPARAVADAREAAASADIICTVTGAREPILLGAWVRPGTHVNVVGSSHLGPVEVDHELVVRSRFIADSRPAVLAAGAEFHNAKGAGLIGDDHVVAEIGEVLTGTIPGRTSPNEITLYKSLGNIVQDLAATQYLHAKAQAGAPAGAVAASS